MELELKELIERDLTQAVVGRIHDPQFYPFWETVIKPSKLTLKILRDGFKVLFKDGNYPKPTRLPNNKSARNNELFVELSISHMTKIGICEELSQPPFIINPLTVADTGKLRLVLDVSRTINPISKFKKMELGALHGFNAVASNGYFQAIMDIKSPNYHVLI